MNQYYVLEDLHRNPSMGRASPVAGGVLIPRK